MQPEHRKRKVPERILRVHRRWTRQVQVLRVTHSCLVIVATISSILASAGVFKDTLGIPNPLAVVAAISIGVVSAFTFGDKANNFRRAWRHLHAAIMRFEEEPEYTMEQLIQAYEDAEKLIGDVQAAAVSR